MSVEASTRQNIPDDCSRELQWKETETATRNRISQQALASSGALMSLEWPSEEKKTSRVIVLGKQWPLADITKRSSKHNGAVTQTVEIQADVERLGQTDSSERLVNGQNRKWLSSKAGMNVNMWQGRNRRVYLVLTHWSSCTYMVHSHAPALIYLWFLWLTSYSSNKCCLLTVATLSGFKLQDGSEDKHNHTWSWSDEAYFKSMNTKKASC